MKELLLKYEQREQCSGSICTKREQVLIPANFVMGHLPRNFRGHKNGNFIF